MLKDSIEIFPMGFHGLTSSVTIVKFLSFISLQYTFQLMMVTNLHYIRFTNSIFFFFLMSLLLFCRVLMAGSFSLILILESNFSNFPLSSLLF